MVDFNAATKKFEERCGKAPESSLMGSILTNMLDPQTKREFLVEMEMKNTEILGNYQAMRSRILKLNLELTSDPMDLSALEAPSTNQEAPATPTEDPALAAIAPPPGQDGKHAPNPQLKCWTCGKLGHPSFLCPDAPKPGSQQQPNSGKDSGKGGGKSGKGKPSWGKGFPGKGGFKGAPGKGRAAYAFDEWSPWGMYAMDEPANNDGFIPLCTIGEVSKPKSSSTKNRSMSKAMNRGRYFAALADESDDDVSFESETDEEVPTASSPPVQSSVDDVKEPCPEPAKVLDSITWPTLPVTAESIRRHHKEMKTRNVPVRLTPDEWARAHEATRTMREAHARESAMVRQTPSSSSNECLRRPPTTVEPCPDLTGKWKSLPTNDAASIGCFDIKGKEPLNAIGEWETIEFTVDSGAAESVVPSRSLMTVETTVGEKSRNGVEYESACGTTIPNEGEKKCLISTNDSPTEKMAVLQVANIGKSLLSVSKMIDKGNTVVFSPAGSYIYNDISKEYTALRRKGNLYVMDAWVRAVKSDASAASPAPAAPVFSRPGR